MQLEGEWEVLSNLNIFNTFVLLYDHCIVQWKSHVKLFYLENLELLWLA